MAIGLDLGSSSAKALRVSHGGRVIASARRSIGTRRGSGGRVEHDPAAILDAALGALRSAAARGAPGESVGIATQRSTVLFWDRDSGRPLTPAYSWQDLRGRALCERLRRRSGRVAGGAPGAAHDSVVAARTGLRLSPHYSASKIAWALRHVRGLGRAVASGRALWGPVGTYLVWRLSAGSVYAIDHANAQRTLLFNLDAIAWEPDLFRLFGIEAILEAPVLPALVPTGLSPGFPLEAAGRSLRLAALTGDQQAAVFGLRCRRPGDIAINYGSGAFVLRNVGALPARKAGLLTTLLASWRGDGPGGRSVAARFAIEGTVNAAATAIEWAQRRLGIRVRTRDLDRYLGPGRKPAREVHFLPAVAGVGAPRWDPAARPRFAGEVRGASPRDLMRAVVESIPFRCTEILRAALPAAGDRNRQGDAGAPIFVAGGLTRCEFLLKTQADLLQREIVVHDFADATGLGAALLAGSAPAGAPPPGGDRRRTRSPDGRVIRPGITAGEAEARYRSWKKAVYGPGLRPG
jgi:glycerol kinase